MTDRPYMRNVKDPATNEWIGYVVRTRRGDFKWVCAGNYGYAATEADCERDMQPAIRELHASRAVDAARAAEIDALPEPLRSLRLDRDAARYRLDLERARTVLRPDVLSVAEERYRAAELAYSAAECAMAEAA